MACVFDATTGEVQSDLYEGDRYRITRAKQDEFAQNYKSSFNKGKHFIKVFTEVFPKLLYELQSNELALFLKLLNFLDYDCSLKHRGKYLIMKEMEPLVDLPYSSIRKIMPRLIDKEVLVKRETLYCELDRKVGYVVNPYIVCRSRNIPIEIYEAFSNTTWNDCSKIRTKNTGFVQISEQQ